jgi:hypothetical protein
MNDEARRSSAVVEGLIKNYLSNEASEHNTKAIGDSRGLISSGMRMRADYSSHCN